MRVDGYVRVSRVAGREGDSFISPDVQREQIEAWVAMADAELREVHVDLDMSGARADRPGLLAALERVERGEIEGIVVARLDRLARSLPVAFDAITRIEDARGTLIAVGDGIDPRTTTGKMARGILLVIAEWYREQVRESWDIARERAVRRGVPMMSTIATGYQLGKHGRLEPHPRWAPVIRDVFERRAGGATWAELARQMTDLGVPVQHAGNGEPGTGRWTGHTVSRLVAGRAYLGEVRSGGYVNTRAHEAIVSPTLWQAAQLARGTAKPQAEQSPALLSGIVKCAGCGYAMYRATGRGDRRGSLIVGYRCRGGGSGGKCESRAYLAPAWNLEALVMREYLHHAENLAVEGTDESQELDDAVAQLQFAEDALRVFRDDPQIIQALGAALFAEGLRERGRQVDDARERVARARMPLAGVPDVLTLRSMWPDLDVVQRRRLLTAAIDCVVVAGRGPLDETRVRICWAGLAPPDLPKRGRGSKLTPIDLEGLPAATRVTLTG